MYHTICTYGNGSDRRKRHRITHVRVRKLLFGRYTDPSLCRNCVSHSVAKSVVAVDGIVTYEGEGLGCGHICYNAYVFVAYAKDSRVVLHFHIMEKMDGGVTCLVVSGKGPGGGEDVNGAKGHLSISNILKSH